MSINLIIGPMFSSKSVTMISILERYYYAGRTCLIVQNELDTRFDHLVKSSGVMCNDGIERSKIKTVRAAKLKDVDVAGYDAIGISEGQFFEDLLLVDEWATKGKFIIVEGLDGDSNRNIFGNIHKLIPLCEKVTKMTAVCKCGADASFTKKIVANDGTSTTELDKTEIIDVGGADKYTPTCRTCFMK